MAITSLTLSSMCGCTWLQSSAPPPPPPPPPRLRACCYSSTQLSVLKTLTHIHSSGVIACLHANRSLSLSLSLILYLGTVLLSYTLMLSYCIFFLLLDSAELALKAARAALSGVISVVSLSFFLLFFQNFLSSLS